MIRKLPKKPKRESRYRSQRHLNHVRGHACINCDAEAPIEAAHVRMHSGTGMGQKPHDWRAVALCKSCHVQQHTIGERTFWNRFRDRTNQHVESVMEDFIRTSPVRAEIEAHRRDNGH